MERSPTEPAEALTNGPVTRRMVSTMFGDDDFDGLRVELRDDGVGLVLFDRPERLNAANGQTFATLDRALRGLGSDNGCGAIVLGGTGRAFCAGMDMASSRSMPDSQDPIRFIYAEMRRTVGAVLAMRDIPQPVIVAVQGAAAGAGFALAAASDIRVCAPDAKFMAPFLKLGVSIGDLGLSWMLPRLIGAGAAAEILYTGRTLGAEEARELRFAQHVVDEPLPTAIELAAEIAARPRLGVQMSKELLNASIGAGGLREHLELELRSQVIGLASADHRTAVMAFLAGKAKT
jgi:enoyl-CoA hydratase